MHIGMLGEAQKILREVETYREVWNLVNAYPSFQPRLNINGKTIDLTPAEARTVLERYRSEIASRASAIGLELDNDVGGGS